MARKLFSLENDETGAITEPEVGGEEVGEVADVATDTLDEGADIGESADAIDTGVDTVDQGEQIEELVENAGEEGLSPVAAEAVRIAIEAVCAKVGYNSNKFYSLYATENFSTPSSAKANTAVALEGVGEFLKDMWIKIKVSLTALWGKVKAFWGKHVSTLGRVVKALESMKSKVSASTGKLDGKAYVEEAPSGLVSAFAGKDDINAGVIQKYVSAHSDALNALTGITSKAEELNNKKISAEPDNEEISKSLFSGISKNNLEFGTQAAPLVGGNYTVVKFGKVDTGDDANSGFEMETEKQTIESAESKLGVSIASKEDLKKVLTSTQEVIKNTVKYKEKADKLNSAISKFMSEVSIAIERPQSKDTPRDPAKAKGLRATIKFFYKLNSKIPTLANEVFSSNVRLAKAVLSYSAFCLKQYK